MRFYTVVLERDGVGRDVRVPSQLMFVPATLLRR